MFRVSCNSEDGRVYQYVSVVGKFVIYIMNTSNDTLNTITLYKRSLDARSVLHIIDFHSFIAKHFGYCELLLGFVQLFL